MPDPPSPEALERARELFEGEVLCAVSFFGDQGSRGEWTGKQFLSFVARALEAWGRERVGEFANALEPSVEAVRVGHANLERRLVSVVGEFEEAAREYIAALEALLAAGCPGTGPTRRRFDAARRCYEEAKGGEGG